MDTRFEIIHEYDHNWTICFKCQGENSRGRVSEDRRLRMSIFKAVISAIDQNFMKIFGRQIWSGFINYLVFKQKSVNNEDSMLGSKNQAIAMDRWPGFTLVGLKSLPLWRVSKMGCWFQNIL
jgi:hypothetical protein